MLFIPCSELFKKKQITRTPFFVLTLAQPPRRPLSTLPYFRVCSPASNSEFRPCYLLQDSHKCTHFSVRTLIPILRVGRAPFEPPYGAVEL